MQAKGVIKFFLVALLLVCLYQLSFTWITNSVEKEAESYAKSRISNIDQLEPEEKADLLAGYQSEYLDSLQNEVVYDLGIKEYTYKECKELQLNLGLDLQGGMSVILQVSLEDMIKSMANNSKDPVFLKALSLANDKQQNSQRDYVTLFGEAITEIDPNLQLSAIFSSREYKDRISFNSTNEDVLNVIKEEAGEAVRRTYNILRTRLDKFGVAQPNISLEQSTGRISVELPGVKDPERVRKLLQATAKLEFWETYDNREVINYIFEANKVLGDKAALEDSVTKSGKEVDSLEKGNASEDVFGDLLGSTAKTKGDSSANQDSSGFGDLLSGDDTSGLNDQLSPEEFSRKNPLFSILTPAGRNATEGFFPNEGPVVGWVQEKDMAKVNEYLKSDIVRAVFPRNMKFLWGAKPINEEKGIYELYAIKTRTNDDRAPLGGDVISDARQDFDQNRKVEVSMSMNSEGARIWKRLTADNIDKSIAIVLDNQVYSAPNVQGEISGGRSSISGSFEISEAKDLANILKAGKLPAPANIVEEEVVGPSLGQESIDAGLKAMAGGLALILIFMVFYYNLGGITADIALLFNLFFIIGVLSSLGATLTLPGIAGIVLTIGMCVDANVLIFERIKEELLRGKGLRLAIVDGYKNSYSSIIDSNLTTLLVGIILAIFGSGPVLGFATVLIIGILSSLFTAILITRLVVDYYISKDKTISFSNKLTLNAFRNINIDFIAKRKIGYIISSILIIVGIVSIVQKGFDFGVDFKGGRTYVVRFDQAVNTTALRTSLQNVFEEYPVVKTFGDANQVKISTSYMIDDKSNNADSIVEHKLYEGVSSMLGAVSFEKFASDYKMSSQKVGPTIADDIQKEALWAGLFALLGMFIYILIRFKKWQYGMGALLALFHDVLIVLGVFSILTGLLPFSLEIDQTFIAAILTVIGYSINDTVVVFDRIREFLGIHNTSDEKKVINDAINTTLSRTTMTSFTTLLVVLVLFLFGGDVIKGFAFALLVGILSGTYSSIFIAAPLVVDLDKKKDKK